MSERTPIHASELQKWMNHQLHSEPGFENYSFHPVKLRTELDEDGCNWNEPTFRAYGAPNDAAESRVLEVVGQARILFKRVLQ